MPERHEGTFTKRGYKFLAEILKSLDGPPEGSDINYYGWHTKRDIIGHFVTQLKAEHPKFDEELFRKACGL